MIIAGGEHPNLQNLVFLYNVCTLALLELQVTRDLRVNESLDKIA